jgi:hypothetical protein
MTHGWTDARRTAHKKAVTLGTSKAVVLAHQINFFEQINTGRAYEVIGDGLAKGARWAVDVGTESADRKMERTAKFCLEADKAVWRETDFFTEHEVESMQLLALKNIVQDFYSNRATEAEAELGKYDAAEVIDGMQRQAEQLGEAWKSLEARVARAQRAKPQQERARLFNAAWWAILSPFFKEHVMKTSSEDSQEFLAVYEASDPAGKGRVSGSTTAQVDTRQRDASPVGTLEQDSAKPPKKAKATPGP